MKVEKSVSALYCVSYNDIDTVWYSAIKTNMHVLWEHKDNIVGVLLPVTCGS
jgi:hypothetical protein